MADTTYEYDADGRLVGSTTVTESEWSPTDRAWVAALRAEEAERCPECGHPMSVCRDPRTAGQWRVIEGICEASRMAQAIAENNRKDEHPRRGLVLSTRRVIPEGGDLV